MLHRELPFSSEGFCNSLLAVTRGSAAVLEAIPQRDVYQVVLSVPDMVRPLQVMRVDISGYVAHLSARAAVEAVVPIIRLVQDEREVRHWSQCDP